MGMFMLGEEIQIHLNFEYSLWLDKDHSEGSVLFEFELILVLFQHTSLLQTNLYFQWSVINKVTILWFF